MTLYFLVKFANTAFLQLKTNKISVNMKITISKYNLKKYTVTLYYTYHIVNLIIFPSIIKSRCDINRRALELLTVQFINVKETLHMLYFFFNRCQV